MKSQTTLLLSIAFYKIWYQHVGRRLNFFFVSSRCFRNRKEWNNTFINSNYFHDTLVYNQQTNTTNVNTRFDFKQVRKVYEYIGNRLHNKIRITQICFIIRLL